MRFPRPLYTIGTAFIALCTSQASAADGDLFPDWGLLGSGQTIIQYDLGTEKSDNAVDSAAAADGSVYIAATVTDAQNRNRIGVSKLTPQGVLDTTFSGDGKVLGGRLNVVANAIALTSDGYLLVAGTSVDNADDPNMLVCRFAATNGLVVNFPAPTSSHCITLTTFNGSSDLARDIVVQPDGKFIVAGVLDFGDNQRYATFARFEANGQLDPSFGNFVNPRLSLIRNTSVYKSHELNAIALASNGKIVGAGSTTFLDSNDRRGLLVRLNSDGTGDSLSASGELSFAIDNGANLRTVASDLMTVGTGNPEDNVYTVGFYDAEQGRRAGFIAKFLQGNMLNNDFGPNDMGYSVAISANSNVSFSRIERKPGGGFFTLGYRDDLGSDDFEVRSFNSDGRASLTFGDGNGYARVSFLLQGSKDIPAAMSFSNSGVIVTGSTQVSQTNFDIVAAKLQYDRIFVNGLQSVD
ncbi:MAG: hypothetical protein JNN30_12625 [Rhodanobacteraceae bacterium]|nr:hypothetical protein [Rhodanobacteraceae bacterium]